MLDHAMSADDILNHYWDGSLPVDVQTIATRLGIQVTYCVGCSDLGDASGVIERKDSEIFITINGNEPKVRQRFTLAHEIGHYALGHLQINGTKFRDTSDKFTMQADYPEQQANRFAADLLMPKSAIDFITQKGHARTVEKLASLFGVSQAAMGFRLRNLGMING